MIKASKNILLSVLTLIFTLMALATTTFAWLTLSKTVTVSNISGDITAGDGLEIALGLDNEVITSFRSHLTASDWQLVMNELSAYKTNAVSTVDGSNFYKLEFDIRESLIDSLDLTTPGLYKVKAIKNVDYLEFKIHFKSYTSGQVKMNGLELLSEKVMFDPRVDYAKTNDVITQVSPFDAYSKDAARVMIGNEIYEVNESNTNTEVTDKGKAVYYGQFSYIKEMGNDIYWSNNGINNLVKLDNTNIASVNIANAGTFDGEVEVAELIYDPNLNYYTANATVKIWIEGFDPDAYDAIFGSKLSINLNFRKE